MGVTMTWAPGMLLSRSRKANASSELMPSLMMTGVKGSLLARAASTLDVMSAAGTFSSASNCPARSASRSFGKSAGTTPAENSGMFSTSGVPLRSKMMPRAGVTGETLRLLVSARSSYACPWKICRRRSWSVITPKTMRISRRK